jgi:hypothetical protein
MVQRRRVERQERCETMTYDEIHRAKALLERGSSGTAYRDALSVHNGGSIGTEVASPWQQERQGQARRASWQAKYLSALRLCETPEDRALLREYCGFQAKPVCPVNSKHDCYHDLYVQSSNECPGTGPLFPDGKCVHARP